MVNEHICKGSKSTTLHTFVITQSGMVLTVSSGKYTQQSIDKYTSAAGSTVNIPTPTAQTYYEIWMNDTGLAVLSRTDGQQFGTVTNPIDRLSWFTVPANTTILDNVSVEAVRMQEL